MNSDVSTYRKVRFGDELLTDLQYIADCFGCPLQHLLTKVLTAYRDGKTYPHPPEYEAILREREWAAKEAQREKYRQGHRQQARLARQQAVAEAVIYKRPLGRPRNSKAGRVSWLRDFMALYGDQLKTPTTPVILGQMVWDFDFDRCPKVGRIERSYVEVADVEAEQLSICDSWREIGNVQLLRIAPGEPEMMTLWLADEAPEVNVEIKPEDDPWPGVITQTFASLRSPQS